jgi:hypothetical protein
MTEQTLPDRSNEFGFHDAHKALQQTAQAMAILRSVWLAVEAQEDGAVKYEDNKFSRWGPAVDAACARVHEVRALMINKGHTPDTVDWWTPLNLMEAMGAALWHTGIGSNKGVFGAEELQSCADAAIDSLGLMYEALGLVCDDLKTAVIKEGLQDPKAIGGRHAA